MARTKRIFREWQHPRDARGRFAEKGSPAWAARAFKALEASGSKADAFSMRADHGPQERGPAFSQTFTAPKKVAPKKAAGGTVAVGGLDDSALRTLADSQPRTKALQRLPESRLDQGLSMRGTDTPQGRKILSELAHREIERRQRKEAFARGGRDAQPAAPKSGMEGVSDRIAAQRGLSTDVPKISDEDFASRYGGAAKAVSVRKAETNPLGDDILDKPGVQALAVAKAARAVPDKENGATAYDKMDRTTLLTLARQAGFSGRGKSNGQIGAMLTAKDEARKAKLNPKGLGKGNESGTGLSKRGVDLSKVTAMGVFSDDPEVRAEAERQIEHGNRLRAAAEAQAIADGRWGPGPDEAAIAETRKLAALTGDNVPRNGMKILAEAHAEQMRELQARRTEAQGGPAKPRVSPAAAAAAERAAAKTAPAAPSFAGMDEAALRKFANAHGVPTAGKSRARIEAELAERGIKPGQAVRQAPQDYGDSVFGKYTLREGEARVEDVGNFTTGHRTEIGDVMEKGRRPKL